MELPCNLFCPSAKAQQENRAGFNACENCGFLVDGECFQGRNRTDPHADRTPEDDRFPPDCINTHDPNYMG